LHLSFVPGGPVGCVQPAEKEKNPAASGARPAGV